MHNYSFKDYEDYLSEDKSEVANKAATNLAKLIYDLEDDFQKKSPENKFLLEYQFCNTDLHLVDKDGQLVDALGRRVDKDGRLINKDGELVDTDGNLLTDDGEYKVEFQPFIDE